jgi:hypothetical protein
MTNGSRTYEFRITCYLAGGNFETEEREIALELPGFPRPIAVNLPDKRAAGDRLVIFRCGGFQSEAEARAAGEPLKAAVMLAGVNIGAGLDVGTDQVVSGAAQRKDGQRDERLQPLVHGLQVVPEIEDMLFGFIGPMRAVTRIRPDDFQKQVAGTYSLGKRLTKRQALASQLYIHSHFQSSDPARFLTLVSAVEALAERRSRPGMP